MPNFTSLAKTLVALLVEVERSTPVLLVINDPERATPTGVVLEALLHVRPDLDLHGLVACGTHRFDTARRAQHVRAHQLDRLSTLHWHDADQPAHTDALLAAFPHTLAIGSVEPHWFAGWTGAHKTLTVGIWPRARIEQNHALALSPLAGPCCLDTNPVHQDLAAALDRSPNTRALDLVLDTDHAPPRIAALGAGTPLEALDAVLESARARFVDTVEAPLDRLVARVAPPLDASLYQALKGVTNHAPAVRPGGALVLVAPCPDGVGIDHFMQLLRAGAALADVEHAIASRGYRLGDHKALRQRQLTELQRLHLALVTGDAIAPEDAAACGFERVFADETQARQWARAVAPGSREHTVDDAAQRVTRVR